MPLVSVFSPLYSGRLIRLGLFLLAITLMVVPALHAASGQLHEGMTRQEVIDALGRPTSIAALGEREIFQYNTGERVEIHNGMLYSARGVHIHAAPQSDSQVAQSPQHSPTPTSTPIPAEREPVKAEPSPPPTPTPTSPEEEEEDAYPLYANFDWEEHDYENNARTDSWGFLLIEAFIMGIFIGIMIKISFAVVGMPLLMSQNLRITIGYILVALGLALIPWGAEIRDFFHINAGLRFIALCTLIYACSDVREGLTVLKIAVATMIVSMVMTFIIVMGILYLISTAM